MQPDLDNPHAAKESIRNRLSAAPEGCETTLREQVWLEGSGRLMKNACDALIPSRWSGQALSPFVSLRAGSSLVIPSEARDLLHSSLRVNSAKGLLFDKSTT